MYPWRFEYVASAPGDLLAAVLHTGFLVFGDGAGTPDVRLGSGTADPGFQANAAAVTATVFNAARMNPVVYLRQDGTGARPMFVDVTGEIILRIQNDASAGYVKGVLSVGPEIILPVAP